MTREDLIKELERLVPSSKARAVYLRSDDAKLAAAIARMKREEARIQRIGHIASTGIGLRAAGGDEI